MVLYKIIGEIKKAPKGQPRLTENKTFINNPEGSALCVYDTGEDDASERRSCQLVTSLAGATVQISRSRVQGLGCNIFHYSI